MPDKKEMLPLEILKQRTLETISDELNGLFEDKETREDIWQAMCKSYIDFCEEDKASDFSFSVPISLKLGRKAQDISVKCECTVTRKKKHVTEGSTASAEDEFDFDGSTDE